MVIPHRDWLLLRGRMRAVAKISVLPILFKLSGALDPDDFDERKAERADDEQDA